MPDAPQDTIEPWERWGLTPHVPDHRSTDEQITELMTNLPRSGSLSETIGVRLCAFKRRGVRYKTTFCKRNAAVGSTFCTVHRRQLFD